MGIVTAAAIVAGASLAGSAISAKVASDKAKRARNRANTAEAKMEAREASRQDVINPYDQMGDLSSMVSNPFANLQVSTKTAEFQAEQSDIALANMLDQSRAFGFGGGGATALAQGALSSKRGIAASIGQQEARNQLYAAQGEQAAMQMRMGEARRMQAMTAEGRAWQFNVQEQRDLQYLDRQAGLAAGNRTNQYKMEAQQTQIIGQAIPQAVSAGMQTYAASDRRLKRNIKLIGYSPNGLKIYTFEYINKAFGKGLFQGVISDEIPQHAVTKHADGYDLVDYSKLDVEFKRI
tara:strand:+ start:1171 stop:2049 length:879 start_codon:yes stop_codon:yes gene_type:complete